MIEDRSHLLTGKLLPGDRAQGQIRFIQKNGHLFREVAREEPEGDPIVVANLIIDMFKLTDLHRRTLQKLRGIVRSEQRVIEEEDIKLSLTNRGRPPAAKMRGKNGQSQTPAAAAEQPSTDQQPPQQTPAAPLASLEQSTQPVTHMPLVTTTMPRPKISSMVRDLELPRDILSLLHAYRNDTSDDQLRAAIKVCMPWQAYTLPNDVRAALEYIDALG